jgi:murein DD-endopeptidase MepM/ murein hydrolase activator NlpD
MPISRWLPRVRFVLAAALVAVMPLAAGLPASATETLRGYEQVVRITFPLKSVVNYSYDDSYFAPRDGGARLHQATDIMAPKMRRIFAAKAGTVCYITGVGEKMPSYGYMIAICGRDGRQYNYLHINNDDPGTDNGRGGLVHAYSPRVRAGATVVRGQFLGYVGDSGAAESTGPHLHFEIVDPDLSDRRITAKKLDPLRINPYYSLRRAERRGDYPGALFPTP